eukprot:TRINITY_DN6076_c0_g1_i1.p1 TRINITY_DN6076_c0_g1~~TRINITY_DN6076_c0_g1_i1.p1  ORF type:complete len:160 (-),score=22.25 TRINITY_DN6076_c0_g1_i1:401-880(-)
MIRRLRNGVNGQLSEAGLKIGKKKLFILSCPMSPFQEALDRDLSSSSRYGVLEGSSASAQFTQNATIARRELATHSHVLDERYHESVTHHGMKQERYLFGLSGKAAIIRAQMRKIKALDRKALCFAQFKSSVDLMAEICAAGPTCTTPAIKVQPFAVLS